MTEKLGAAIVVPSLFVFAIKTPDIMRRKEEFKMILFTILAIMAVIAAVVSIAIAAVFGGAVFVIFGDVIVCVAIIALIVKVLFRRRKK